MLKKIYLVLAVGVILVYSTSSWFGWEFAGSGSRSMIGVPFVTTGGFRGGK